MRIRGLLLLTAMFLTGALSAVHAQNVDVDWIQTDIGEGAADDTNNVALSLGLGSEIIVVGENRSADLGFIASFDSNTGTPASYQSVETSDPPFGTRVDFFVFQGPTAIRETVAGKDWLVTGGAISPPLESARGFLEIRSRETSPDLSNWAVEQRITPEPINYQMLATTGLELLTDRFFVGGGIIEDPRGWYDGLVAAYDLTGRETWRDHIWEAESIINIHDMEVSKDRLYVAGSVAGGLPGAGPRLGDVDGFIRVYQISPDAEPEHLWTRRFATGWRRAFTPGLYEERLVRIAIDHNANVYAAGATSGRLPGALGGESDIHVLGGLTSFVIKFRPDGEQKWAKEIGGRSDTRAFAITVDCRGAIWVGGYAQRGFGHEPDTGTDRLDSFIVRLRANGTTQWADSTILSDSIDDANGHYIFDMRLDGVGHLLVTGFTRGSGTFPKINAFVAKLNDKTEHGGWAVHGGCFKNCPMVDQPLEIRSCGADEFSPGRSIPCLCGSQTPIRHEGFPGDASCLDNLDNDNDGLCDRQDPDCRTDRRLWEGTENCCPLGPDTTPRAETFSFAVAGARSLCTDGIDNDADGICDFAEESCRPPKTISDTLDRRQPIMPIGPGKPIGNPWSPWRR